MSFELRACTDADKQGWLRCRVHVRVHPDYRRRGIASALLERALADARALFERAL